MNCPRCRRSVPPDARLCCYCGKRLADCESRSAAATAARAAPAPSGRTHATKTAPTLPLPPTAPASARSPQRATRCRRWTASTPARPRPTACATPSATCTSAGACCTTPKSASRHSSHTGTHTTKAEPLHRRRIAELKTEDYQAIIQQIADAGGSRSLCEKQRQLFSQLCQYAIHQDIIHTNYATALSLPSPSAPKTRVLSAAEVSAIWGMANDSRLGETAKIALVLVYTGMRLNELLTVRRDDVHLAEGYLIGGEKRPKQAAAA